MTKSKGIFILRKKVDTVGIIFQLVKHLAWWILILGVGWYYFNNQQFQQATNQRLWQARERVAQLVTGTKATGSGETGNQSSSKATGADQVPTNGRWPSQEATVFVNTGNSTLNNAVKAAIQSWNQTGAFRFQTTSDQQQADIVVKAMNNNSTNAAGLTETSTNPVTGRVVHADIYLNAHYLLSPLYGYSNQRIINTAEHELGHAIGLDHSNSVSVMQPAGSYYPIQPADVQAVKKLYSD